MSVWSPGSGGDEGGRAGGDKRGSEVCSYGGYRFGTRKSV